MAVMGITAEHLVPFDVFSMRDADMRPEIRDLNPVARSVLEDGIAI